MTQYQEAGGLPEPLGLPVFVEREDYEAGFAAVFARQIAPELERLEQDRLARYRDFQVRLAAVGGIVASLTVAILWLAPGLWWVLLVLIALAAWVGNIAVMQPARGFGDRVRDVVMAPVCTFLGGIQYRRHAENAIDPKRFAEAGVVESFTSARIEDLFVGRYRETGFAVVDARLVRAGGRSRRTVFHGLLFTIEVPRPFSGHILIGRDFGKVGNTLAAWFKSFDGMRAITLDHPEFEAIYAVYADSPDTAPEVLTPVFLDSMVAIAEAAEGAAVRAAFTEGTFVLALPTGRDLFAPGSIFRSVYDCEDDIRELLWQVTIVHRLIDYLHGDDPGRLN